MSALRAIGPDLADRETMVRELAASVTRPLGLSPQRESAIRHLAHQAITRIIGIEDSLAVKALELEACERRANAHVQGCRECRRSEQKPCSTFRSLRRRMDRLQWAFDAEYRQLARRI